MPMNLTLYAATSSAGKLRDFAAAALPHGLAIAPLPGLAGMPTPEEDAPTFQGNADLKAIAYSRAAPHLLVLADDSGLEVPALGYRPGVLSARFAETLGFLPDAGLSKDERNNRCLLSLLHDLEAIGPHPSREARFICALSVARDGQVLHRAEGTVAGEIVDTPRGTHGFGYDALFVVRGTNSTLAEIAPAAKWALSHRGEAFRALLQQFR